MDVRSRSRVTAAVLAVVCACALAPAARATVTLVVSPETLSVAPGATFTLELRVPVGGAAFNGYDAVVEYDPAKLTFLPTSPTSLQQGADMTGACGNTFHLFRAAGDSLSISNVLLCEGQSLTGPATLYQLRFRAANSPGTSWVRLRRVQFFDAGWFVNPAVSHDALVSWGVVLDAGAPPPVAPPARLAVSGNPARGEQWFELAAAAGTQQLTVYDTAGRVVRRLERGTRPAGARRVRWDGRDDRGRPVPAGLYLVRFDTPGGSARASVVRLP